MLKLTRESLADRKAWQDKGFILPEFDVDQVKAETAKHPEWIHFGPGNIFRMFPAAIQQDLLNKGLAKTGVIVAEGYDYEIIDAIFDPHDNLTMAVTLNSDGSISKQVIASITEALKLDSQNKKDFSRLQEIFSQESLQVASFTITEKGYQLANSTGEFFPQVEEDFSRQPGLAMSYMGKVASLIYKRYLAGAYPLTLQSMDNCSHNGDQLKKAILTFAEQWLDQGQVDQAFVDYVQNKLSFPWSMIDKITPRPDAGVEQMLQEAGFVDTATKETAKHSFVAPFVNAEATGYLVIEDSYVNGMPAWDKAGVIFTDRETVDKVEKMKVCTCLNPLHTCLAILGCLLGYHKISDEMQDEDLVALIKQVGYKEGLPVVVDPKILSPTDFIDTVINDRFPNPFMPDTPQRIAMDTSQKLAIRFGETIKAYQAAKDLELDQLELIPFVLAAWLRYLLAVDDQGRDFSCSPDPLLADLQAQLDGIKLGDQGPFDQVLDPILANDKIFGLDLSKTHLAQLIKDYFTQMVAGPGEVRKLLHKLVG